ncbi:helix-turn-helix domain-containing protein [Bradyrhizobium sediminis]|uniref:Helix-turn-helix domain-containing protein n=1 Tax=Bradyrhizobium sediminis TaxID=2840469 RepID=A0A975NGS7_9BRAD|nr:helix-turn-helix transcriptional regulator [Bradyrhizobium sediminis]QWG14276.1 helix-turn-helix domain-containing protein [Bradyrhizobium sediminis]
MAGAGGTIGARIRYYRTANNLTQAKLAEATGVSDGQVSRWENGKEIPNQTSIGRLASTFGIHVRALTVGDKTTWPPHDSAEVREETSGHDSNIWNYPKLRTLFFEERIARGPFSYQGETVLLYEPRPFRSFQTVALHRASFEGTGLPEKPTLSDLLAYIDSLRSRFRPDVIEYLIRRANMPNTTSGIKFSDEKVGVEMISLPTPIHRQVALSVFCSSFWLERELNRRIVLPSVESALLELARREWHHCLMPHVQVVDLYTPSTLYLEMAIITQDEDLLLLRKAPSVPNFSVWSCSVERGFRWGNAIREAELPVQEALNTCLGEELQLSKASVCDWGLLGIGLQVHLNTCILGFVKLSLSTRQLQDHLNEFIQDSDHFTEYKFLPMREVWSQLADMENELHPSALLRVHLVLKAYGHL